MFTLAQLSDPHIGADWEGVDPEPRLAAAVAAVSALRPDAVLVSGDLTENASGEEYARVQELLAPLDPVHTLPGNHDDAGRFQTPYAADLGPLRLLALDSTIAGEARGELGDEQLAWLDGALASAATTPALVALHHPPIVTGIAPWDALALDAASREALGAVVARHPQVRAIAAGHVHRAITGTLAGRPVVVAPSTYLQARLDFTATTLELAPSEPAGFVVHTLRDGRLLSHTGTLA